MTDFKVNENFILNRYSRQMLLNEIGFDGQMQLLNSSIAVIGAGGIGSTVLYYLAGAGIGHIHIIDGDKVEESNLHRQIIHSSSQINQSKAVSARNRMLELNPNIIVTISSCRIVSDNAISLISNYQLIIDATDNYETRYVLNDACVLLNKTLISGSAVGLEGQITVISPFKGPCYRCIYPQPSFADSCRSCDNAGVLGPIPGLIGCLEALEAIKILSNPTKSSALIGKQIFFDGLSTEFHSFQLPERNINCISCGNSIRFENMNESSANLIQMQENSNSCFILPQINNINRISCANYAAILFSGTKHILLDVRSDIQYGMVSMDSYYTKTSLDDSIESNCKFISSHISLKKLRLNSFSDEDELKEFISVNKEENHRILHRIPNKWLKSNDQNKISEVLINNNTNLSIYVLCRRGIDSILATDYLLSNGMVNIYNIDGGLTSWKKEVDENFPAY